MIIDKILELAEQKLIDRGWTCNCRECLYSEFSTLTDEEILDIVNE